MTEYERLTSLFNQSKRHKFSYKESEISKNGIYIMFEKGERYFGFERIVRIGSHTGQNRLFKRIDEHFMKNDHRDSIFRKHLGRCFLTMEKNTDYIKNWDLKIKRREDKAKNYGKIDWELEKKLESRITDYIRNNFTFTIIPNLIDEVQRLKIEKGLISTFAQETEKKISPNWLGRYHPNIKILNSGLWNVNGLKGKMISENDIELIESKLN